MAAIGKRQPTAQTSQTHRVGSRIENSRMNEGIMDDQITVRRGRRLCLRCDRPFLSKDLRTNHICEPCNLKNQACEDVPAYRSKSSRKVTRVDVDIAYDGQWGWAN